MVRHKAAALCEITSKRQSLVRSRSFRVIDFGTDRKPVYNFLLVNILTYIPCRTVSELSRSIGQIIAFSRECLYLTPSFGRTHELWAANFCLKKTRNITQSCGAQYKVGQKTGLLLTVCNSRKC